MKDLENRRILKEFGQYAVLLPKHLKSQAADRPYNKKKNEMHLMNTEIIDETFDNIEKGKEFNKKVKDFIL